MIYIVETIKLGFQQAGKLAFLGLTVGVIAGWVGLFTVDSAEQIASLSAKIFLSMALILPVALIVLIYLDLQSQNREHYLVLSRALSQLSVAGIFGAIFASFLFLMGAAQIPAVFGQKNAAEIAQALYPAIGWQKLILVLISTVGLALVVAVWGNRQAKKLIEPD